MLKIKCAKCKKDTYQFNLIEFKTSCLPQDYQDPSYSESYLRNKDRSISKYTCDECYDKIMSETFKNNFL